MPAYFVRQSTSVRYAHSQIRTHPSSKLLSSVLLFPLALANRANRADSPCPMCSDWLYGKKFQTAGASEIWYRTGYREKAIGTVLLGSIAMFTFLVTLSPPARNTWTYCCCSFCPNHGGGGMVSRFKAFIRLSKSDMMDRVGSDAARYLEFQKLILRLYARLVTISICITIPVNVMGGSKYKEVEGGISVHTQYYFLRTTLHNLDPQSPWMWMHLAIFYIQSAAIYHFIYSYQKKVIRMASATLTKSASAACSVMIYGLPTYAIHDNDLKGAGLPSPFHPAQHVCISSHPTLARLLQS